MIAIQHALTSAGMCRVTIKRTDTEQTLASFDIPAQQLDKMGDDFKSAAAAARKLAADKGLALPNLPIKQ